MTVPLSPPPPQVSILSLLLEYPTLLCPDAKAGQEVAAALLSLFTQLGSSPKQAGLRQQLLFAAGTVLVATEAFGGDCPTSRGFLALLLALASDPRGGLALRTAACECLRELESCCPGLLSRRLASLRCWQEREASAAHQGYALLYGTALRNAVVRLAQGGAGTLGELLAGSGEPAWEACGEAGQSAPGAALDQLLLLPSPGDLKELKAVLSALLDGSYLLAPAAQSHLLGQLAQAASVVRAQSPAVFKAQLARLFGSAEVGLLQAALQLKGLFTDSLFTAEDEAFLLRRLVGLAQHPALPAPLKLLHLDGLLHFPENRPLGSGAEEEESLPVLLTPRAASGLFPGLFQDQGTVLARLNLLGLVCTESEGPLAEQGAGYLLEHVLALGRAVAGRGGAEPTRLFFRAAFLFARYFGGRAQPMAELSRCLLELYRQDCSLAPHLIDLLDKAWALLEEPAWAGELACATQALIVGLPPPRGPALGWHLKVLARLAKEGGVPQGPTLRFLSRLVAAGQLGGWRSGQGVLSVCRNWLRLSPPPSPARVADLLQAVHATHGDVDVRDRARFYHTLLANLSGEKLAAVLAPGGPVKARTLSSSIVADSESFVAALTVHRDERPPLRLQRVERSRPPPEGPPCAEDDEEGYGRWLLESRPPAPLRLTFRPVPAGPRSDLLLCVVLRFACASRHYAPVPDLCVPCLSGRHPSPPLTLTLQPRCPFPTRLAVSAVYSTREGLTRSGRLEPLEVAFPDLFLPLAGPAWPPGKRQRLFDALWRRLCPDPHAESLVCWPVPPPSLGGLVERHFAPYLLAGQAGSYAIGMALPPQCHVLLRVRAVEDAARVQIRTDHWELLPSLNAYFQTLVEAG